MLLKSGAVATVGAVVVPLHPTDCIVPALVQPGTLALVPEEPDVPLEPDVPDEPDVPLEPEVPLVPNEDITQLL